MRRNWPREGRQPVRDAGGPVPPGAGEASPAPGGTGAKSDPNSERRNCPVRDAIYALGIGPVRGANSERRSHKLPREGRNLCDLRRIFADAKILASDFCVRKNPSAYYALVRSFSVAERFAERKRSVISDLITL